MTDTIFFVGQLIVDVAFVILLIKINKKVSDVHRASFSAGIATKSVIEYINHWITKRCGTK